MATRCVGFDCCDPTAANNDPAFAADQPTEQEIVTAVADVRCKRSTNLVAVWATVETAYQNEFVDAHHHLLPLIRQVIDARLTNAEAVLRE